MAEKRADTFSIRTPEGIAFPLPLAGPMTRFLGWGIDLGVTITVCFVAIMSVSLTSALSGDLFRFLAILLPFAVNIGYSMVLEWLWRGQTLGKFVVGSRVMDVQGLRLHFSQVVIRNLIRLFDALPLFYLVGGVAMMVSRRAQRLGDLAANTVVIRVRKAPQPDFEQLLPDKYNSFRAYPHLESRLRQRISPDEVAILLQALLRRNELTPEARVMLYADMVQHFNEQVPFPEEGTLGLTDEQYLRNLVDSLFRKTA